MTLKLKQVIRQRVRNAVHLFKISHSDGTKTYLNSGYRNIDWDDGGGEQIWLGASRALSLTLPDHTGIVEVSEFTLSLSGLSSDYRSMAAETVRGQAIVIYLGFINDAGEVFAYETVEQGLQDRVTWEENELQNKITLHCLGGLSFIANQIVPRWSPEPHAAWLVAQGEDADSDTGFDEQHAIPNEAKAAAWWPPS